MVSMKCLLSGRHVRGHLRQVQSHVGAQDRALGAVRAKHAHLPHPEPVVKPGSAFGQFPGDDIAGMQGQRTRGKLLARPWLAAKLVIGEDGHALGFKFAKEFGRIPLAVEDNRETHSAACGRGRVLEQSRDDLLAQHGDEARVNRRGDDEKGLAPESVDPVIGGAPQTEPLPGDVAT